MKGTQHKFYSRGVDNQLRADAFMELKRPDMKQIKKWGLRSRIGAETWINDVEKSFNSFVKEFRHAIRNY